MNKELIIKTLFSIQDQIIVDLKERISAGKAASDMDENDTIDPEDFSHQNESVEMNQLLQVQLSKAERDRDKLYSIDFLEKTTIEEGALVKTDHFSFIVGIASFPFTVEGKQYVGISKEAPIFAMMRDKKIGEKFSFANNNYEVVSIN